MEQLTVKLNLPGDVLIEVELVPHTEQIAEEYQRLAAALNDPAQRVVSATYEHGAIKLRIGLLKDEPAIPAEAVLAPEAKPKKTRKSADDVEATS